MTLKSDENYYTVLSLQQSKTKTEQYPIIQIAIHPSNSSSILILKKKKTEHFRGSLEEN